MKARAFFPWLFSVLLTAAGLYRFFTSFLIENEAEIEGEISTFVIFVAISFIFFVLIPSVFSALGTLIVTRRNGNWVGWLMLIVAFFVFLAAIEPNPMDFLTSRNLNLEDLSSALLILFLVFAPILNGNNPLPIFIPLLLIVLHFPNGKPPSRRWRRINLFAIGTLLLSFLGNIFGESFQASAEMIPIANPIGFIPESSPVGAGITILIVIGLLSVASGSVASIVVRYRRGSPVERLQIRWLLFAGAVFFVVLVVNMIDVVLRTEFESSILLLPLFISILSIPAAVTIAILRYRLWDIDIIIRRTFTYALLSAVLGLVYYGAVLLLQGIFQSLSGDPDSALVTVLSTLAIAALFNPLRTRIQGFIDRRFYRQKYDAERTLAHFSSAARDEVDLDHLADALLGAVDETLQPERVVLWLRSQNK